MESPATTCVTCGRALADRRRWRARGLTAGAEVKYCSKRCRRRLCDVDRELERHIARLLAERAAGATCCPSEAARRVRPDDWRDWMEPARCAARRMVARGELQILQGGRVVDPSRARGPIRVRLATGALPNPRAPRGASR